MGPPLPCGSPSRFGLWNRLDPHGNLRSLKAFLSPMLLFGYFRNMVVVAAGIDDWNLGAPEWLTRLSVPLDLKPHIGLQPGHGVYLGKKKNTGI